jgi:2-polyprenyl-3-methyl-5-hydroxy-6-metoxy-1,4-benzoquinol methylase
MDQPGLDVGRHIRALDALGRANTVSLTAASLWPSIRAAAGAAAPRPIRVLDIACGGGHVLVSLARRAARERIDAEWVGWDVNPTAVDYARTLAARSNVTTVRFDRGNGVRDRLPADVDVLVCTLFLHHLEEADAVALLRRMIDAARCAVVVSDLRRTALGTAFTWVGSRLLSRSDVFLEDGMRSVAAAFTTAETRQLAANAGLHGATVSHVWPQRWLLVWRRDGARP